MNKPAKIKAGTPETYPDYHSDGYGWAMAQAALIRAGRLDSIDWENVAEEIESVGRSERSAYQSHLSNILLHMIKWEIQPERRGMSWWLSIMNARADALGILKGNPGLKQHLVEIFEDALAYARAKATRETSSSHAAVNAIPISFSDAFDRHYDRPEGD